MSDGLVTLLVHTTNPVVTVLLLSVLGFIYQVRSSIEDDIEEVKERTKRLEDTLIGGDN